MKAFLIVPKVGAEVLRIRRFHSKIVGSLTRFLFNAPWFLFLSLTVFMLILKGGLWISPTLEFSEKLAKDPFVNPFENPSDHIWIYNWLAPLLAWMLNLQGTFQLAIFYLICNFVAFALIFWKISRTYDEDRHKRIGWLLFLLLPVSGSIFFWLSYDSLTFLLLTVAVIFLRNLPVSLCAAFLLGFQHTEQSLVAFTLLFIALILQYYLGAKTASDAFKVFLLIIATLIGRAVLHVIFSLQEIDVNSGRIFVFEQSWALFLQKFAFHWPFMIWATLGVGWLLFIRCLDTGVNSIPLIVPLAIAVASIPFYYDSTRVFGLITLPLLLWLWILNNKFVTIWTPKQTVTVFGVWAIVPFTWAFGGRAQASAFPFDVAYLVSFFTSSINPPEILVNWIFAA